MATKDQELSRRSFCKGSAATALGAVAFLTLGSRRAAADEKMPQKQAAYQATPKGDQQCDKCKLFQPPDACTAVDGKISPDGWCRLFQPKGESKAEIALGTLWTARRAGPSEGW